MRKLCDIYVLKILLKWWVLSLPDKTQVNLKEFMLFVSGHARPLTNADDNCFSGDGQRAPRC